MKKAPDSYLNMILMRIQPGGYEISEAVKKAFIEIPRSYFIDEKEKKHAYIDKPLHIPAGQTISAPSMYALMLSTELGHPIEGLKILEIGTGSGYGAGLLAYVVGENNVYTIERHIELVNFARANLTKVGLSHITIIHDNGTQSIPEINFDRIIVTASGKTVPEIYIDRLNNLGRIIMPIINEAGEQWIWKISKDEKGMVSYERKMQVLFVPLIYNEN